ncbi:hypothetical protein BVX98_07780 [bacterium F11]|nr:hypothetical protein BVX98_07780 [bacterium F11]
MARTKSRKETHLIVDVGGTKTRLFLHSHQKSIPLTTQFRTNRPRLVQTLRKFIKKHRIKDFSLHVGLRGVWTPQEKSLWRKNLKKLTHQVTVHSDIELAHETHFGKGPGLVLNAGTGSIAYGRNKNGKTARAGGLGPLFGDEGSAFWMGKEFLKRADHKNRKILIIKSYLRKLNTIYEVSKIGFSLVKRTAIPSKTRLKSRIIKEAHHHLLALVRDVINQLKWKGTCPVVLRGGLFENNAFRRQFIFAINQEKIEVSIKKTSF